MSLPKPYYQRGPVTLFHGDCLELLPHLPRVDAVVTDPPYGIGITKSHRLSTSRGFGGETWDDVPCDPDALEWMLSQKVPLIVWGGNYFDLPPTKCVLVWDKMNDGRDFADLEQAWTNLDSVARIFRMRPMNMDGGKVHPTQKPVRLMEWCLSFVPSADVVLDPFAGSGSTAVAAIRRGCSCIAIEREKQHCETIADRIDRELDQKRLPFDAPKRTETQRALFAEVTA